MFINKTKEGFNNICSKNIAKFRMDLKNTISTRLYLQEINLWSIIPLMLSAMLHTVGAVRHRPTKEQRKKD